MLSADDQPTAEITWGDLKAFLLRHGVYVLAYLFPGAVIGYAAAGIFCARIFLLNKRDGIVEHLGLSAVLWGIFVANVGLVILCSIIFHLHLHEEKTPERTVIWGASVEAVVFALYLYLYGFPQDF
jgi:hypothetical protein